MGLYRQGSSTVWWMSYSFRGRQVRKSTGTTNKKVADTILSKVKTQIAEGDYLESMRGKNKTFADAAERYLKEVTPDKKPNTQRDDKFYAKTLCKFFGEFYLNEITADLITQYLLKRKKKVGPSSINRELAFFSASFNKAYKLWGWCRENPVSKIKREKEKKRVKYFSDEEFSKIFALLADWVKPIVLLAKNTGLRLSNLANLRWVEVHLKNKIIILDGEVMKNAETLGMPLNQVAVEVIGTLFKKRKLHHKFVFCHKNGDSFTNWGISAAFKKACVEAGYPEFRFHDLRHDFCSKLVQSGVDLYTVKELAGHKDITTTQRYAHLSRTKLKQAVSALDKLS
jgi:integrase